MSLEPRTIRLTEAVSELKETVEQLTPDEACPYFFIAGGGISWPTMPLSADIVKHCRQRTPDHPDIPGETAAAEYSRWLRYAYPQPRQRQRYFADLVRGARVNAANLFLAHILVESRLAHIVVTPNFDDLLIRALRLFGISPQVFDHPATVSRVTSIAADKHIVQVHGSYHSYHLANLEPELAIGTSANSNASVTMSDQLLSLMRDRSAIVIGYAGWENDAIMSALSRRLTDRLPFNLYWFLYTRDELARLPAWLRNHPEAYFVVADSLTSDASITSVSSVSAGGGGGGTLTPEPGLEKLDAAMALHDLIVGLKLGVPKLLDSPLDFFLKQISTAVDNDVERFEKYSFKEAVESLRRLKDHASESQNQQYTPYAAMVTASRAGVLDAVVEEAAKLDRDQLTEEQFGVAITAVRTASESLQIDTAQKRHGLRLLIRLAETHYRRWPTGRNSHEYATAVLEAGQALEESGSFREAVEEYCKFADEIREDQAHYLRARALEATRRAALAMSRNLGRTEDAMQLLEAVSRTPVSGKEMRIASASIRLAYAEVLTRAGHDPVPVLDAIIADYREGKHKLERTAAEAWIRKGVYLWGKGKSKESFATYDEVLRYAVERVFLARYAARAYRDLAFMYERQGDSKTVDVADEGLAYLDAHKADLRPSQEVLFRLSLSYLKGKALASRGTAEENKADIETATNLFRFVVEQSVAMALSGEEYVSSLEHLAELAERSGEPTLAHGYRSQAEATRVVTRQRRS